MMVVRKQMNQLQVSKKTIPASVWVASPVPIDQGTDDVDSIRERILAGKAYLKIVEYPWGVEFDVCSAGDER